MEQYRTNYILKDCPFNIAYEMPIVYAIIRSRFPSLIKLSIRWRLNEAL